MNMMNLDEGLLTLFRGTERVSHRKCVEVLSSKGEKLGDYDFFFEWFKVPDKAQIDKLKEEIDEVLEPLDVEYTITTKTP